MQASPFSVQAIVCAVAVVAAALRSVRRRDPDRTSVTQALLDESPLKLGLIAATVVFAVLAQGQAGP
ncbi:hypothetical protein N866_02750 [Actinotalea ferrariae CF5-4]|uniref:Uncharacterized protein n=1 Tax=Actinotalea ferrariae CF5-4 TaxID=948458 RepID=A0A021VVP1_9CELL|nr:hypothetical protein [Actinotalea ferrariae]EYR63137.1 hypothetical protein N866_02750 [Actinotalea ferrariae CF5-4]